MTKFLFFVTQEFLSGVLDSFKGIKVLFNLDKDQKKKQDETKQNQSTQVTTTATVEPLKKEE